jgi:hypothetical protein
MNAHPVDPATGRAILGGAARRTRPHYLATISDAGTFHRWIVRHNHVATTCGIGQDGPLVLVDLRDAPPSLCRRCFPEEVWR